MIMTIIGNLMINVTNVANVIRAVTVPFIYVM